MRIPFVDLHTAGEPFRIVRAGLGAEAGSEAPEIPGASAADRRAAAIADQRADGPIDRVRRLLCHEPRGHRDMYGGFVVPPDDDGADFGVVFWHKDGYSTACGHGTIALGAWAIEEGIVAAPADGEAEVVIDCPSGRVRALARMRAGRIEDLAYVSVPARVLALDVPVETSAGPLAADLSFAGATYAQVRAADAGLAVTPEHYGELVRLGREIKWALDAHPAARHPEDPRLDGVYATMWFDELPGLPDGPRQRNLVVFADGQADRSPCGSGTAARCATLRARGILAPGGALAHESIIGSVFRATAAEDARGELRPIVRGSAHRTLEGVAILADGDELGPGFLLG